ncbi:MAG: serine hydrolase [Candidatus Liptonbacteria bacterium]
MKANLEKFAFLFVLISIALLGMRGRGSTVSLGDQSDDISPVHAVTVVAETVLPEAKSSPITASVGMRERQAMGAADVFAAKASPAELKIKAEIAMIADLETGHVYFDKNSDRRWPIASISKLFTAEFALDQMSPDKRITITEQDEVTGGDLTRGLQASEQYTLDDLVRAMLVFSSNEAAEAMAKSFGRDEFLRGLNLLVENWGMTETHLADPTGLSSANQSTGKDLIVAAQEIYRMHPEIFEATRRPSVILVELNSGQAKAFANINAFAGQADFLGGKTGFTNDASGNLLSLFSYEKRPIFVLVMGSSDRFSETEKLISWFRKNYVLANPNP